MITFITAICPVAELVWTLAFFSTKQEGCLGSGFSNTAALGGNSRITCALGWDLSRSLKYRAQSLALR